MWNAIHSQRVKQNIIKTHVAVGLIDEPTLGIKITPSVLTCEFQ